MAAAALLELCRAGAEIPPENAPPVLDLRDHPVSLQVELGPGRTRMPTRRRTGGSPPGAPALKARGAVAAYREDILL